MKVSMFAILILSMFALTSSAEMSDWKTELNKYSSWNTKKEKAKREIAEISKPIPVNQIQRMPAKEPVKITPKTLNHENMNLTHKYEEKNEL